MSSHSGIDSEQPGYLMAQYMNSISHDIIHNRSNRKSQMKELGNFCAELKLQTYGQTYLRSSIAVLMADLCGDNIESLNTWAEDDWENYKVELICCFKILIRKDARHFFIPGVERLEESSRKKSTMMMKNQLRYKNRDVDVKVKQIVSKDFRDAILRIEVQRALSIIRSYLDTRALASSDTMEQSHEEKEKIQNYIACVQGTIAFEKHPSIKEALLSFIDQERICLKERANLLKYFKDNSILKSHTLEELYVRVEIMLRGWEMLVLPRPTLRLDYYDPSDHETDDGDSYILKSAESLDENDGLDEEEEEEEEEKIELETETKPLHSIQQKQESPAKYKGATATATATAPRSEDDASFETAVDVQEETSGILEPRTLNQKALVEDLVIKRNVLRVDAKDPLASAVKVAATARVAPLVNEQHSPLKKMRLVMEDSDLEGGTESGSGTSPSPRRKKRISSNSKKKKRKIVESSDDDELWEDTEVKYNGGGVRHRWTEEETKAVRNGYEIYGKNWATIKKEFSKVLAKRSNVQIKVRCLLYSRKNKHSTISIILISWFVLAQDKFRTMVRTGEIVE